MKVEHLTLFVVHINRQMADVDNQLILDSLAKIKNSKLHIAHYDDGEFEQHLCRFGKRLALMQAERGSYYRQVVSVEYNFLHAITAEINSLVSREDEIGVYVHHEEQNKSEIFATDSRLIVASPVHLRYVSHFYKLSKKPCVRIKFVSDKHKKHGIFHLHCMRSGLNIKPVNQN